MKNSLIIKRNGGSLIYRNAALSLLVLIWSGPAICQQTTGSVTKVVHDYLFAASTMSTDAIKPFLSSTCTVDITDEFKTYLKSNWTFSGNDLSISNENIDSVNGKASVTAFVVYKGGNPPTYMSVKHTIYLVQEGGTWKISGINPPPAKGGPAVVPISQ